MYSNNKESYYMLDATDATWKQTLSGLLVIYGLPLLFLVPLTVAIIWVLASTFQLFRHSFLRLLSQLTLVLAYFIQAAMAIGTFVCIYCNIGNFTVHDDPRASSAFVTLYHFVFAFCTAIGILVLGIIGQCALEVFFTKHAIKQPTDVSCVTCLAEWVDPNDRR